MRLATVTNLTPYSYDENGTLRGVDIDVIREIAKRTGIEAVIEPMPWARVLISMRLSAWWRPCFSALRSLAKQTRFPW